MALGFSLDGVTDMASGALSGATDFAFNSGGDGGGFFSTAADFAGNAFGWINDNPDAANLLGGVAMAVGKYYNAEQDREQQVRENRKDRQLQRELATQQIEAAQITPGNMGNTGGYVDNVTQGLISNGMLASKQAPNA